MFQIMGKIIFKEQKQDGIIFTRLRPVSISNMSTQMYIISQPFLTNIALFLFVITMNALDMAASHHLEAEFVETQQASPGSFVRVPCKIVIKQVI